MSKKSNIALAKKLAKINSKQQVQEIQKFSSQLQDIEEVPKVIINSPYFSPLQTRSQRKTKITDKTKNSSLSKNVVATVKLEPKVEKSPTRKSPNKIEAVSETTTIIKKEDEATIIAVNIVDNVKWEPTNWQTILRNIRQMRSEVAAPVDSMGCHKCSDDDADEKVQRFHKLVALMLSSQTKDETTFEAMHRLRANQLTPSSLIAMDRTKLEDLLKPVSFYKNKAKFLQQTSQILIDKYDSDIPDNVKELIALPGVGPKMAHICMATAWNIITGIGVDVHVHRISNRLKWVPKETKEPEQTRIALEAWLPHELWQEVNHLLVGFGQTVCTPVRPHCLNCLNRDLCPSADIKAKKNKTAAEINTNIPEKLAKFAKSKIKTLH